MRAETARGLPDCGRLQHWRGYPWGVGNGATGGCITFARVLVGECLVAVGVYRGNRPGGRVDPQVFKNAIATTVIG